MCFYQTVLSNITVFSKHARSHAETHTHKTDSHARKYKHTNLVTDSVHVRL